MTVITFQVFPHVVDCRTDARADKNARRSALDALSALKRCDPVCHDLVEKHSWWQDDFRFDHAASQQLQNAWSLAINASNPSSGIRFEEALCGQVDVGLCQSDAWCVLFLLLRLSAVWPDAVVVLRDSEGETLLIELEDELRGLSLLDERNESVVSGRVALVAGCVVALPVALPASASDNLRRVWKALGLDVREGLSEPGRTVEAIRALFSQVPFGDAVLDETVVFSRAATTLLQRASDQVRAARQLHRSVVVCPPTVAFALARNRRLPAVAVSALHDLGPTANASYFLASTGSKARHPQRRQHSRAFFDMTARPVRVAVWMTRFAFAIAAHTSLPKSLINLPPPSAPHAVELELGAKLTLGLEAALLEDRDGVGALLWELVDEHNLATPEVLQVLEASTVVDVADVGDSTAWMQAMVDEVHRESAANAATFSSWAEEALGSVDEALGGDDAQERKWEQQPRQKQRERGGGGVTTDVSDGGAATHQDESETGDDEDEEDARSSDSSSSGALNLEALLDGCDDDHSAENSEADNDDKENPALAEAAAELSFMKDVLRQLADARVDTARGSEGMSDETDPEVATADVDDCDDEASDVLLSRLVAMHRRKDNPVAEIQ